MAINPVQFLFKYFRTEPVPQDLLQDKMTLRAQRICEHAQTLFKKLNENLSRYNEGLVVLYDEPEALYDEPEALTLDAIASGFITQWFNDRIDKFTIFVVSVGSNRSEQQCYPSFAKSAKVAILNIDPTFTDSQFLESASSDMVKMKFTVERNNLPTGYASLTYSILKTLNLGKKVILLDSTAPTSYERYSQSIVNFIDSYQQHLGHNFAYIQSYFDGFPVAILNKHFFCMHENGEKDRLDLKTRFFKVWDVKKKDNLGPITDLTPLHPQPELDLLVTENNLDQYGRFFASLKDIRVQDLFQ